MSEFDGESGQVENVKDRHYCMEKSWESRNNREMNRLMGYGNMADMANTPAPPTEMTGERRNTQIMGNGSGDNDYNYNADRGK